MAEVFIPHQVSPANTLFNTMDRWSKPECGFLKREVAARVMFLLFSTPAGAASSYWNMVVVPIKTPVTLAKYTIGYIPLKGKSLGSRFNEGFELTHLLMHIYKIVAFVVATGVLSPIIGFVHPRFNIWVHVKLGLVHIELKALPKTDGPKAPPPPPPLPTGGKIPPKKHAPVTTETTATFTADALKAYIESKHTAQQAALMSLHEDDPAKQKQAITELKQSQALLMSSLKKLRQTAGYDEE